MKLSWWWDMMSWWWYMMLYEGQDGPQDFSAGRQDGPKRGQDGNIGGLKICTRLCTQHRFFLLRCKKVMLKTSCGEIKKTCVLSVFCAKARAYFMTPEIVPKIPMMGQEGPRRAQDGLKITSSLTTKTVRNQRTNVYSVTCFLKHEQLSAADFIQNAVPSRCASKYTKQP